MVKTQGRHGEVAGELHTDFPERFAERKRLYALDSGGGRRELELEHCWPHKSFMILKFAGVDSISAAEELVGAEIQIPADERSGLEAGAHYISDLVGCAVVDAVAGELGKVKDVQFGAGEAPLLIVQGAKEYMVPYAAAYLKKVDMAGRRIEMELPPGMLELDAPVTAEEKERQRGQ